MLYAIMVPLPKSAALRVVAHAFHMREQAEFTIGSLIGVEN
jgi:hypothetical protein